MREPAEQWTQSATAAWPIENPECPGRPCSQQLPPWPASSVTKHDLIQYFLWLVLRPCIAEINPISANSAQQQMKAMYMTALKYICISFETEFQKYDEENEEQTGILALDLGQTTTVNSN